MHTVPVAVAARRLGRPVKIVVPRWQIFHDASFRPPTRHHVRLGADRAGQLVAAIHEVKQQTSRHDLFPSLATDMTGRLYGIGNFRGRERLVRTDVQTPGFMRTPWEQMAAFAFETAIDELAYALGQDPVALRIANDTATDPISGKPFSSRHLVAVPAPRRRAFRLGAPQRRAGLDARRRRYADRFGSGRWRVPCEHGPGRRATSRHRRRRCLRFRSASTRWDKESATPSPLFSQSKLGVTCRERCAWIGDTDAGPQHNTAGCMGHCDRGSCRRASSRRDACRPAPLAP